MRGRDDETVILNGNRFLSLSLFPSLEIKKRGRRYLFSSGKCSVIDAVVEKSFFLLEDSSVVSHHKRRTSELAFPFVRRKEADFVV